MSRIPCAGPESGRTPDPQDLVDITRQKAELDHQYMTLGQRRNDLRDRMLRLAREYGQADQHGHRHIRLPAEVTVGDKVIRGFTCRRSARSSFDEAAALELAERKGITDLVVRREIHTFVDQDALWAAQQRGLVSADEIDALITTTYMDSLWGT